MIGHYVLILFLEIFFKKYFNLCVFIAFEKYENHFLEI